MEVSLKAAEGQAPPTDTFVSLRIGDVQKQSRFAKVRNFCFPNPGDGREAYGRLEIFKRVGQRTLTFTNMEDGIFQDIEVPCEIPGMDNLSLSIAVKGAPAEAPKELKEKAKSRKEMAQKYLNDNKLEETLAKAMREVIQARPDDPYAYLAKMFHQLGGTREAPGGGRDADARGEQAAQEAPDTRQDKAAEEQDACELTFSEIPFQGLDQAAFKAELLDNFRRLGSKEADLGRFAVSLREGSTIAEIRGPLAAMRELRALPLRRVEVMGSKAKLTSGFTPEELQAQPEVVAAAKTPPYAEVADVLMKSCQNGKLGEALSRFKEPEAVGAADTAVPETEGGVGGGPSRSGQAAGDLNAIRSSVRGALMEAAGTNRLSIVLEEESRRSKAEGPAEVPPPHEQPDPAEPDADAIEALRQEAKALLTEAAGSGRLGEKLEEAKGAPPPHEQPDPAEPGVDAVEALRQQAKALLSEAAGSGRLGEKLREAQGAPPLPEKPDAADPQIDAIRAQAKAIFTGAAASGTLGEKLREAKGGKEEVAEEVSKDVCELTFKDMSFEGLDHDAFKKELLEGFGKCGASDAALARCRVDLRAGSVIAEVRGPASAMGELKALPLSTVTVMGSRPEVAFREAPTEAPEAPLPQEELGSAGPDMDALREQAKALLSGAATSGKLGETLREVKGAPLQEKPDADEPDVSALREQTRALLSGAVKSGELAERLQEAKGAPPLPERSDSAEPEIDALRAQAKALLSGAVASGALREKLQEAKGAPPAEPQGSEPDHEALRLQVAAILSEAAESGAMEQILRSAKEAPPPRENAEPAGRDIDELRQKAQAFLFEAADTGKLAETLRATMEAQPDEPKPAELDIDAIRGQAAAALCKAAEAGNLEHFLGSTKEAKPEEPKPAELDISALREQAAAALNAAADAGSLEQLLRTTKEVPAETAGPAQMDPSLARLKAQAKAALVKGARGGNIGESMEESRAAQRGDMWVQHEAELLRAGLRQPEAPAAPAEDKPAVMEINDLRKQARAALVDAAKSGQMQEFLATAQPVSDPPAPTEDKPAELELSELRKQAKSALVHAAKNGKMDEVLAARQPTPPAAPTQSKPPTPELDDLRQEAKSALFAATKNGNLDEVLLERKQAKAKDDDIAKDVCELTFKDMAFEGLDQDAFKKELLQGFGECGASDATLARCKISLRPGSVIAEVRGPTSAMGELKALPLSTVTVMGSRPEVSFLEAPAAPPEASARPTEPLQAELDVDSLRRQAREALVQASKSGVVQQAFEQAKKPTPEPKPDTPEVDSLCAQASDALREAADSGKLAQAVKEVKFAEDDNALRSQLMGLLSDASGSGLLTQTLQEVCPPAPEAAELDIDAVRAQVGSVLLDAASNGKLMETLAASPAAEAGGDTRAELRGMLSEASRTEALAEALRAVSGPRPDPPEPEARGGVDGVKAKIRDAFESALDAKTLGSICEALAAQRKGEVLAAQRYEIFRALAESCSSGQLAAAVSAAQPEATLDLAGVRRLAKDAVTEATCNGLAAAAAREAPAAAHCPPAEVPVHADEGAAELPGTAPPVPIEKAEVQMDAAEMQKSAPPAPTEKAEVQMDAVEMQKSAPPTTAVAPEPTEMQLSSELAPAQLEDAAQPQPTQAEEAAEPAGAEPAGAEPPAGGETQAPAQPEDAAQPQPTQAEEAAEPAGAEPPAEADRGKPQMLESRLLKEPTEGRDDQNPPSILTRTNTDLVKMDPEELISTFKSEIEWRDQRIQELRKRLTPEHRGS